jgi:hypothetical protein
VAKPWIDPVALTWLADDSQKAYPVPEISATATTELAGIVVRNVNGSNFPDGCKEKVLIKDGNFPSWWRGLQP